MREPIKEENVSLKVMVGGNGGDGWGMYHCELMEKTSSLRGGKV